MLKYGTEKFLPHYMNSVLVKARDAFKVSDGNIIRETFVKTKIPPLTPPEFTTNTQACAASIKLSSGYKAEEINNISRHTVGPIEVKLTSTDDTIIVLWWKGAQQSSRNIITLATAYDAARKQTVLPIQEMKK